jgi:hypothetical protein
MMRVKYVGKNIGVTGLYGGNTYEVSEIDEVSGALRVVDEDKSNWNYDNEPDWKPGYLYSPTAPRPLCVPEQAPGKFYIVEDDENGSLAKAGVAKQ